MDQKRDNDTQIDSDARRAISANDERTPASTEQSRGITHGVGAGAAAASGVSGGVAGGTSGDTGSAAGSSASDEEAAGSQTADERSQTPRADRAGHDRDQRKDAW